MRILGLMLALGAITWAMYQASGGGEAETGMPAGYQQSLQKAKDLERGLMDTTQNKVRDTGDNTMIQSLSLGVDNDQP